LLLHFVATLVLFLEEEQTGIVGVVEGWVCGAALLGMSG
jgi:hypothetical protein